MKTALKVTAVVVLVILVAIQFIGRPEHSNPPEDPSHVVSATVKVPPTVQDILDRSCMDCHSHRTRWPWYSHVAPVSWLVVHDVEEGREELNFSEWGTYSRKRQMARLEMISVVVDKGEMPMKNYVLLHGEAALSEADKDLLCSWAEALCDSLTAVVQ